MDARDERTNTCITLTTVVSEIKELIEEYSVKDVPVIIDPDETTNTNKSNEVKNVTESQGLQSSKEVELIQEIVESAFKDATPEQTVEVKDKFLGAMSDVLDTDEAVMERAEKKTSAASKMVDQIEKITEKMSEVVTEEQPVSVSTPNIAALIMKVPSFILEDKILANKTDHTDPHDEIGPEREEKAKNELQRLTFEVQVDENGTAQVQDTSVDTAEEKKRMNQTEVNAVSTTISPGKKSTFKSIGSIEIPSSTFQNITNFTGTINIIAYDKPTLFQSDVEDEKIEQKVDSVIVKISLGKGKRVSGNPAVVLDFVKKNASAGNDVCVYWKVRNESVVGSRGRWDTDGCQTKMIPGDGSIVRCECTHFTNFALLITPEAQVGDPPLELIVISKIGAYLSLGGMVLTIIAHGGIKKLRNRLPSRLLLCFSISLSALLILFLAAFDRTDPELVCQVVAGLIQYFMLSTFAWMAVTAVNLYRAAVVVFKRESYRFFIVANLLAWGVPAVVVILSGVLRPDDYRPTISKRYCFVSGTPFNFGVLLPVAATIFFNIVILITVLVYLARKPSVSSSRSRQAEHQQRVKMCLLSSVLLGITWIFGLLAVGQATYVFMLLFDILNAFQGFIIFVAFTVRNPIVKEEVLKRLNCQPKSTSSSSQLSSRVEGMKTQKPKAEASSQSVDSIEVSQSQVVVINEREDSHTSSCRCTCICSCLQRFRSNMIKMEIENIEVGEEPTPSVLISEYSANSIIKENEVSVEPDTVIVKSSASRGRRVGTETLMIPDTKL